MRHTPHTYSELLRDEFEKRRDKNRVYSLRAFARDLGLSSSTASRLLRGKIGLSPKKASQIAERLGFTTDEVLYFTDLVLSVRAKDAKDREQASLRLRQHDTRFTSTSVSDFRAISAWYTFAVMELIRLHGDLADNAFLARKLKITEQEVRLAIQGLRSVNALLATVTGYEVTENFIVLPDGDPDASARKFHQDILDRAKASVIYQNVEERVLGCAVVRARKKDLPWIAKEMRDFRRNLAARIEQGDAHDTVYALSMQMFRLDQDE